MLKTNELGLDMFEEKQITYVGTPGEKANIKNEGILTNCLSRVTQW